MRKVKLIKGLKPKKVERIYKIQCLSICNTVDPEKHWEEGEYVVSKEDHDKLILNYNFKSIK